MTKNKKPLKCNICDEEVESCDDCYGNFEIGDEIYCRIETDKKHVCSGCSDVEGEVIE